MKVLCPGGTWPESAEQNEYPQYPVIYHNQHTRDSSIGVKKLEKWSNLVASENLGNFENEGKKDNSLPGQVELAWTRETQ